MKYCFYVSTAVCCSDFSCYAISFPYPHIFNSSGSSQCLPRCNSANVLEQMEQAVLISKDFEEKSAQIDAPNCDLIIFLQMHFKKCQFQGRLSKKNTKPSYISIYIQTLDYKIRQKFKLLSEGHSTRSAHNFLYLQVTKEASECLSYLQFSPLWCSLAVFEQKNWFKKNKQTNYLNIYHSACKL